MFWRSLEGTASHLVCKILLRGSEGLRRHSRCLICYRTWRVPLQGSLPLTTVQRQCCALAQAQLDMMPQQRRPWPSRKHEEAVEGHRAILNSPPVQGMRHGTAPQRACLAAGVVAAWVLLLRLAVWLVWGIVPMMWTVFCVVYWRPTVTAAIIETVIWGAS